MKNYAIALALVLVAANLPINQVAACENRIVAHYKPGANWGKLEQTLPDHLQYVGGLLKSKVLQSGGPELGADGHPTGGLLIFVSADRAAAEAAVKNDPFIKNAIADYELTSWMQCEEM